MNVEEISLQKGTTHQDRSSSRGHRGESSVVSAVLVVALVAGSGLMIAWLLHQYVLDLLEEGLAANRLLRGQDREELEAGFSAFRDLGPFTGIFSALFSVVQWPIWAGMLTAIAVLLGGRGEFERVFVRTGPAHIPILLGNILMIALLLTIPLPRDVTLPANERDSLGFLVSFQEASQSLWEGCVLGGLAPGRSGRLCLDVSTLGGGSPTRRDVGPGRQLRCGGSDRSASARYTVVSAKRGIPLPCLSVSRPFCRRGIRRRASDALKPKVVDAPKTRPS